MTSKHLQPESGRQELHTLTPLAEKPKKSPIFFIETGLCSKKFELRKFKCFIPSKSLGRTQTAIDADKAAQIETSDLYCGINVQTICDKLADGSDASIRCSGPGNDVTSYKKYI